MSRIFSILIFFACILSMNGQQRRTLVIGLGEYEHPGWSKIHGDNDVPLITDLLRHCSYQSIATLTNSQATKQAIIDQFNQLVRQSHVGDTAYIHFSGHGQLVTDLNGDEDDGYDEAWIPYDAKPEYTTDYHGQNHLIDDEIVLLLQELRSAVGPSGQIIVVVDACHSGDSTRLPDDDNDIFIRGIAQPFEIPLDSADGKKTEKAKEEWTTLTACKNYQANFESKAANGQHCGALSLALSQNYKNFAHKDNPSIRAILENSIKRMGPRYSMTPTLTGDNAPLSTLFTSSTK
ncbi:MAG: caspase family protein [Bacteroidales bacterium]|nr:caspase family protein [Bacteroidales bacterium]